MPPEQANPAFRYLDLHTHILPGVDDGPESSDLSLEMIAAAVKDGAVGIAATPHRSSWAYSEPRADYDRRLNQLRQACVEAGLQVELYSGGETYLIPQLVQPDNQLELITINDSKYLLFELPFEQYPPYVEEVIFELQVRGFKLVMAHAERYTRYHQDVNRILPLLERGVLAQINIGSLAGDYGGASQETAKIMLGHRMAQLVASDAHSPVQRPHSIARHYGRLVEVVGAERAQSLVLDVPTRIVQGRDVPESEPAAYQPRQFWQLWRRQG